MSESKKALTGAELWFKIREETELAAQREPILASFLHLTVLSNKSLDQVLAFHLSSKLSSSVMDARALYDIFFEILRYNPEIYNAMEADLGAHYERDPACSLHMMPLLYFKGFHALQSHRINHWLWLNGRQTLAYFLQNRISEVFSIDIHPAARFGKGIMLDHGTGLVVGETAVLGDNISILHGVTLGGSGKETGDRHPKVEDGVMIGANASILGNIRIGRCARIGAGSVVVSDVPCNSTVVGVPAKIVSTRGVTGMPSEDMNQSLLDDDCGCP